MKSFSIATILFSAFVIASPALMFGRGESHKALKHSHTSFKKHAGHKQSMGEYLHPGDAAFRK